MKNHLLASTLALLALCPVVALAKANATAALSLSAAEIPIQRVAAKIHTNGDTVAPGTSRVMVSLRLGSPSAVLADGSWLYYGYSARLSPSGQNTRGTLVVRFKDSAVTRLTLADDATVTALRQAHRRPDTNQLLAVR